ncbi:MAG: divalent-cation tolerance protein CutA, partial [Betaproteobacteria bacterium]|nr:divalent-cation tolerance protein CutA [Betaproteobacteria bacterium]
MTEHQRSQNQVTENQIPEHPKAGLIALHTSVGSEADALALAKMALEAKRAACVQIDTIQSLYPWDGSIQHETEWRILFKT